MNKFLFFGIVTVIFLMMIASCQYKDIVEPVIPPDPYDTVFFSQDILPIWNDGNNCTSCHSTGGTFPDLTPDHAYNEITSTGLIDTQNPPESIIYSFPEPESDTHAWKKYTNAEATSVLQWIEQGALDN